MEDKEATLLAYVILEFPDLHSLAISRSWSVSDDPLSKEPVRFTRSAEQADFQV